MADKRSHQIMAAMRGGRPDPVDEQPKLTGAAAEIHGRLRGMNAGSVPPPKQNEESKARFEQMVRDFQLEQGLSRADAEVATHWALRQEREDAFRRQGHEAMERRTRDEPRRVAQAAIEAATRPRVKRLPNGDPVPGTTVNDLIAEGARDPMVEKIRVAALSSYDDLVAAGLLGETTDQEESDAAQVAELRAITGAHR